MIRAMRSCRLPGSTVDASLRFAIGCWPVADPLQRYQVKKAAGEERFVISHDKFWPSEADMAGGQPDTDPDPRASRSRSRRC